MAAGFSVESDDLAALRDRYLYRALKGEPAEQVFFYAQRQTLGTQRDFHVSALCVEDPSPPSTIDANHRRHRRHQATKPPRKDEEGNDRSKDRRSP